MKKKDLKQSFEEGLITQDQYKEELFKLETAPKPKKKSKKLATYLTPEEFDKLIGATKQYHHKIAFLLAYGSGLRISEIVGGVRPTGDQIPPLERNKVDLIVRSIFIQDAKGGKQRVVPLPKGWKVKMMDYLPLTKTYSNVLSARRSIQKAFHDAAKRAGLLEAKPTLHIHSLRHSFGTRLVNQGVPLNQVQMLMGHSNLATTSVYTHANPMDALKSYEDKF